MIIDLIMLSKFGKNDGGRETWAYNFLPELLNNSNINKLNIFGYKIKEEEDNSDLLIDLDNNNKSRVKPFIINDNKRNIPRFFSMFIHLKLFLFKLLQPAPDYTIAIGGLFEVLLMLANKRFKKGKTIVWLRSVFVDEKSSRIPLFMIGLARKLDCWLLSKVDIILANGDDIKAYYNDYGLDVKVVKNGVDSLKWNLPPPIINDTLNIAYIGRFSKVKGIEPFLALIKKIKSSEYAQKFDFHIAGHGEEYISEIVELSDDGLISYYGSIDNSDMPNFLKKIDVCVALTYSSLVGGGGGTSNALMEQMSASRIIIAWDNAIFRQLLNEKTAYLVKQDSIESLYEAFLHIYRNPMEATNKAILAEDAIRPYTICSQVEKFKNVISL